MNLVDIQKVNQQRVQTIKSNFNSQDAIEERISKAFGDYFEKGKKLPVGTIRTHGGHKRIKTAQGWRPYKEGGKHQGHADELQRTSKIKSDQDRAAKLGGADTSRSTTKRNIANNVKSSKQSLVSRDLKNSSIWSEFNQGEQKMIENEEFDQMTDSSLVAIYNTIFPYEDYKDKTRRELGNELKQHNQPNSKKLSANSEWPDVNTAYAEKFNDHPPSEASKKELIDAIKSGRSLVEHNGLVYEQAKTKDQVLKEESKDLDNLLSNSKEMGGIEDQVEFLSNVEDKLAEIHYDHIDQMRDKVTAKVKELGISSKLYQQVMEMSMEMEVDEIKQAILSQQPKKPTKKDFKDKVQLLQQASSMKMDAVVHAIKKDLEQHGPLPEELTDDAMLADLGKDDIDSIFEAEFGREDPFSKNKVIEDLEHSITLFSRMNRLKGKSLSRFNDLLNDLTSENFKDMYDKISQMSNSAFSKLPSSVITFAFLNKESN